MTTAPSHKSPWPSSSATGDYTMLQDVKQPQERTVKKVLIAYHCDGRTAWMLADATKVGNHYKVSACQLTELQNQVRLGNTQKRCYI